MKSYIKILFRTCLIFIAGFFILDFPYLWYNAKNIVGGKIVIYSSPASVSVLPVMKPDRIMVEDLKITAPIIYPDNIDEKIFEADLNNGVVHYPGTALPGGLGNCYIFGHSSNYIWVKSNYKTIFAPLTEIAVGDDIFVSGQDGQVFKYTVTKTFVTSGNDVSVLSQQDSTKKLLTLQTSYPLGTALRRFIVQAEIK